MIRPLLLMVYLLIATPALAQTMDDLRNEIDQAHIDLRESFGIGAPGGTGANQHAGNIGGIHTYLINVSVFYRNNHSDLGHWKRWMHAQNWSESDMVAAMSYGMGQFRQMDGRIRLAAAQYVRSIEYYGTLVARARAIGLSVNTCRSYYSIMEVANPIPGPARKKLLAVLRPIQHARMFPAGDQQIIDIDAAVTGLSPAGHVPLAEQSTLITSAIVAMSLAGMPTDSSLAQSLDAAARHAAANAGNLPDMLARAASPDGRIDLIHLQRTRVALADRLVDVMPVVAAGVAASESASADLRGLVDAGKRLVQAYDDVNNPFASASGKSRAFSGLRAVVDILNTPESGPDANRAASILNDLFTATSSSIPVIAIPQGGVVGILQSSRQGMLDISHAMAGVDQLVRTGNPRALRELRRRIEAVRQTLNPANFLRRAAEGVIGGWASNAPLIRTFLDRVIAAIGEDLAESDSSATRSSSGRCL